MTNKIKILTGLIALEIIAIAFSFVSKDTQTSVNNSNSQTFALTDTVGVSRLVFGKNILQQNKAGKWTINEKHLADAPLMRQLFALLQKIDIKKPVSANLKAEIIAQIAKQGIDIQFGSANDLRQSFKIIGKEGECYAMRADGEVFVLYVPGYNISLSEVFYLSEGDWREKTVIASRFAGVKKVAISYTAKPQESFVIQRDSTFFKVEGISKLDTNMVGNYVDAFKSVRVFSFLDKPVIKDSLQKIEPYCVITLEDIDKEKSNTIKVFANKQSLYGILGKTDELVELEMRYFTRFLVRKKDFEK
jgi:hypothetical protein